LVRIEANGGCWLEAELYRLRGELLLALPDGDPIAVETAFRRAIAVARDQSAKLWELRAATSLARFWRMQGRSIEACGLLTPIYGWFTEGLDTPDLQDAYALLHKP
jgi:predicted ATPase